MRRSSPRPALLVVREGADLTPFRACFASLSEVGHARPPEFSGAVNYRYLAYRADGAVPGILVNGCDAPPMR